MSNGSVTQRLRRQVDGLTEEVEILRDIVSIHEVTISENDRRMAKGELDLGRAEERARKAQVDLDDVRAALKAAIEREKRATRVVDLMRSVINLAVEP
jgi:chromosome segregation ATPase